MHVHPTLRSPEVSQDYLRFVRRSIEDVNLCEYQENVLIYHHGVAVEGMCRLERELWGSIGSESVLEQISVT